MTGGGGRGRVWRGVSGRWGALAGCVVLAFAGAGCRAVPGPSESELEALPLDASLPGDPPRGGIRYWASPFRRLPLRGCYVTVTFSTNAQGRVFELWQNTWGDGGATNRGIQVQRGGGLDMLTNVALVCDGTLIDDVPEPGTNTPAPGRGYTRPAMWKDADAGYVLMACVCPDYRPGSVSLLPAILTSRTGTAGDFDYRGKITGEPAEEAGRRPIWSDGGALLRLSGGRWRMYLNGFGTVLAAVESDGLEGPWRFLRDGVGGIRELLPDFPSGPKRGGCFPTVVRVDERTWHLWITDRWPPQSIWHFWSEDGMAWRLYGRQPEITRAAFRGHGIKCLRAYVDPDTGQLVGLLSVWGTGPDGEEGWILHESRMPAEIPSDWRTR